MNDHLKDTRGQKNLVFKLTRKGIEEEGKKRTEKMSDTCYSQGIILQENLFFIITVVKTV